MWLVKTRERRCGNLIVMDVEIRIDGVLWRERRSLVGQGPQDRVFVVDREAGMVRFGDGVQGRRPSAGATILVAFGRGAGAEGNVPAARMDAVDAAIAREIQRTVIDGQISSLTVGDCKPPNG
jgi:hypothetical protein